MTEVLEPKGKTVSGNLQRPALSQDAMFRLWRAAIKDDNNLNDMVIEKVYEEMIAFDRERAEGIIQSIVRRDKAATANAFPGLLQEMRERCPPTCVTAAGSELLAFIQ
jgi:hypothetical protein